MPAFAIETLLAVLNVAIVPASSVLFQIVSLATDSCQRAAAVSHVFEPPVQRSEAGPAACTRASGSTAAASAKAINEREPRIVPTGTSRPEYPPSAEKSDDVTLPERTRQPEGFRRLRMT